MSLRELYWRGGHGHLIADSIAIDIDTMRRAIVLTLEHDDVGLSPDEARQLARALDDLADRYDKLRLPKE